METVNKENKKKSFNFSLIDNTSTSIPAGNITFILSFCIPALIFLALYYLRDIFPFGNDCYLRSDMYHQYAPFYSELWHKLRTGDTLLYSWDIGMGVNFTSLFASFSFLSESPAPIPDVLNSNPKNTPYIASCTIIIIGVS